jgi:hypothetical protein
LSEDEVDKSNTFVEENIPFDFWLMSLKKGFCLQNLSRYNPKVV